MSGLPLPEPHCMTTSLLVLIGPSATGKSTLARALADRGLVSLVPTWTTRPRRPDEPGDTAEHRFIDTAGFNRLRAERALLAESRLPDLPYRYGLPRLDGLTGIALVIPGPTRSACWPRPPAGSRSSTRSVPRSSRSRPGSPNAVAARPSSGPGWAASTPNGSPGPRFATAAFSTTARSPH